MLGLVMQDSLSVAKSITSEFRKHGEQPDVYEIKKFKFLFIEINLYKKVEKLNPKMSHSQYAFSMKNTRTYCSFEDLLQISFWNKFKVLKTDDTFKILDPHSRIKKICG